MTFRQRTCIYAAELTSPKFALGVGFMSAFGQFSNSPHIPKQDFTDLPHRFATYYGSRTARDAGELIAGYLHHEEMRPRVSDKHGVRPRIQAALLGVLTSPDEDGHLRMAFSPIAGSLSQAFASSAMYRHNETMEDSLSHAGFIYGRYFMRAIIREFKPEMNAYVRRILRRDKN